MKHLQDLIKTVEATGGEIGVTLLVSGVVVSGYITPWTRFVRWEREVLMRTAHEGGRSIALNFGLGPIMPDDTREARESWDELVREREKEGTTEDDVHFDSFALRSAVAETSVNRDRWREFTYLVSADSVDAPHVGPQPMEGELSGPDAFDARYREPPGADDPADPT
jgi:hypothetical protein